MKNIHVMNPYLLGEDTPAAPKNLQRVHCKGGGGGGSSAEYERQLREQREATERAEAEAARLKQEGDAAAKRRKDRQGASLLTPGEGEGDSSVNVRKSVLGSWS